MQRSISSDDLHTIVHEADAAARRLQRRLRLSRDDLDDLRQDLIADLLARLPGFDSGRGSLGAFAGIVMTNRSTRIAQRVRAHRRMYGAQPVSLDDVMPAGDGATRGDLISEEQGLAGSLGHWANPIAATERSIDLERGLGTLNANERRLAASLLAGTPHQLAKASKGSRSALYRHARELRLTLMAAGVAA